MLTVKTELRLSTINGIGVFTLEDIPKGKVVWKFTPGIDVYVHDYVVQRLPDVQRHFFTHHAYRSKHRSDLWVVCMDHTNFTNHSYTPNLKDDPGQRVEHESFTVAARDIAAGEELTSDYRDFDADFNPDHDCNGERPII